MFRIKCFYEICNSRDKNSWYLSTDNAFLIIFIELIKHKQTKEKHIYWIELFVVAVVVFVMKDLCQLNVELFVFAFRHNSVVTTPKTLTKLRIE